MKTLFLSISFMTILGTGSWAHSKTCDTFEDPTPHAIFLIHGLLGDETTFGELENIIHDQYRATCKKNIKVFQVRYFTAPKKTNFLDNLLTDRYQNVHPFDFAKVVYVKIKGILLAQQKVDQLNNRPLKEQFGPNTNISYIVHSQGGITMMSLLNSCVNTFNFISAGNCPLSAAVDELNNITNALHTQARKQQIKALEEHIETSQWNPKTLTHIPLYRDDKGVFHSHPSECLPKHLQSSKYQCKKQSLRQVGEIDLSADDIDSFNLDNYRNLISLSTPFGGSPIANASLSIEWIFRKLSTKVMGNPIHPEEQVRRLAIGSKGLSFQRAFNLNSSPQDQWIEGLNWSSPYNSKYRMYNLGAVVPLWDKNFRKENLDGFNEKVTGFLVNFLANPGYFENDVVVGTPEARSDFLYFLENKDPSLASLRGKTEMAHNYSPLKVGHVPLANNKVLGISVIDYDNYEYHPAWALIKKIVEQKLEPGVAPPLAEFTPQEKKEYFVEKLQNFTSEIRLLSPSGYHRPLYISEDDIEVGHDEKVKEPVLDEGVFVRAKSLNKYGLQISDHFGQSYYHIGKVNSNHAFFPVSMNDQQLLDKYSYRFINPITKRKYDVNGIPLDYKVNIVGFEEKEFTQHVLPSYNSYAEIYLKPILPYPSKPLFSTQIDPQDSVQVIGSIDIDKKDKASGEPIFRVFYLDKSLELKSKHYKKSDAEKLFSQSPQKLNQCHVGVTGQNTDAQFRHPFMVNGKPGMIKTEPGTKDADILEWAGMWGLFAPNQGGLYAKAYSHPFDRESIGRSFTHRRTVQFDVNQTVFTKEDLEQIWENKILPRVRPLLKLGQSDKELSQSLEKLHKDYIQLTGYINDLLTEGTSEKSLETKNGPPSFLNFELLNVDHNMDQVEKLRSQFGDLDAIRELFSSAESSRKYDLKTLNIKFKFPDSLKPKRLVEVLGRFTQVPQINGQKLIDSQTGLGRDCTLNEKMNYPKECETRFIDRYLITSSEIRAFDKLGYLGFKRIGRMDNQPRPGVMAGLRWVNVNDIDMFKGDTKLPFGEAKFKGYTTSVRTTKGTVRADECLRDYSETSSTRAYHIPFYYATPRIGAKL